jgi:probable rRNA maturation factor
MSPMKIKRTAQAILNALDCPDGELSILLVDNQQIETLNRDYLNREGPTNVIAFPMREGQFANLNPHLLGDVVISVETAHKEAEESKISLENRFRQLLAHGILHLLGYNHVETEEAQRMETKTNELLNRIECQ